MRTAEDRRYDAIKVENRLFEKIHASECSGADALEIAKFLLQRLASESGDVAEGLDA